MSDREHPSVFEINALNAAAAIIDGKGKAQEVRTRVRTLLLTNVPRIESPTDLAICAAMAKITGVDVDRFKIDTPSGGTWEEMVTYTIAYAWTEWAAGRPVVAANVLPQLRSAQEESDARRHRSGAINLMAMSYWLTAVEALAKNDLKEADRYWRRALELGSHFGTDSHLLVSWTYVATFFPND